MTSDYTSQITVGLLLLSLVSVLAVGLLTTFLGFIYARRNRAVRVEPLLKYDIRPSAAPRYRPSVFEGTCRWLVIKSAHVSAVQSALGLHNPIPCSWGDGVARLPSRKLFVSPPVRGWILVIGQGLPDPADDVDQCFHFLTRLSRALGQVQFFSVNRAVNHHAWVRIQAGQIQRAYAWAGDTLWNQGPPTPAETELGLKCFDYGEKPTGLDLDAAESGAANSEKILLLAAGWSFDPTTIEERALGIGLGVAGDVVHSKQH